MRAMWCETEQNHQKPKKQRDKETNHLFTCAFIYRFYQLAKPLTSGCTDNQSSWPVHAFNPTGIRFFPGGRYCMRKRKKKIKTKHKTKLKTKSDKFAWILWQFSVGCRLHTDRRTCDNEGQATGITIYQVLGQRFRIGICVRQTF